MIVVDSTVLADHLFGEEARRISTVMLLETEPEWISLGLAVLEIGNVAWKLARFGGLADGDAVAALSRVPRLLKDIESRLEAKGVYEIARASGLTFYDASYVWLARSRGLTLRTRDREILGKCPDIAVSMPAVPA